MASKKKAASGCCIGIDETWQVEDALRTLERAEQIKRDPKLMPKVRKLAKERLKDIQTINQEKK